MVDHRRKIVTAANVCLGRKAVAVQIDGDSTVAGGGERRECGAEAVEAAAPPVHKQDRGAVRRSALGDADRIA